MHSKHSMIKILSLHRNKKKKLQISNISLIFLSYDNIEVISIKRHFNTMSTLNSLILL